MDDSGRGIARQVERAVAARRIGAVVRRLREERGLTLERLALGADISYQYLSGIENGKENFSIGILERIAEALDLPLPAVVAAAYAAAAPAGPAPAD